MWMQDWIFRNKIERMKKKNKKLDHLLSKEGQRKLVSQGREMLIKWKIVSPIYKVVWLAHKQNLLIRKYFKFKLRIYTEWKKQIINVQVNIICLIIRNHLPFIKQPVFLSVGIYKLFLIQKYLRKTVS